MRADADDEELDRVIEDYADGYRSGGPMPPGVVFRDQKGVNWLADGFQRLEAAKKAGFTKAEFDVYSGEFEDAKLYAAGANQKHGLRRTNADKRRAVRFVLEVKPNWSNTQIGQHVGVTHVFVGNARAEVAAAEEASQDEDETVSSSDQDEVATVATSGTRRFTNSRPTKEAQAKAITRILKADHAKTDDAVAEAVGCKAKLVAKIRKSLTEAGHLPKSDVPTRAEVEAKRKKGEVEKAAKTDPKRFGDLLVALKAGADLDKVYKELRKREKQVTTKGDVLLDQTEYPVPGHLRDLFGDRFLIDAAEAVESIGRDGVKHIIVRVEKKGPAFKYLACRETLKALQRAEDAIEVARSNLDAARPYAVHRTCEGKGCKECRQA